MKIINYEKQTGWAFTVTRILNTPFWALYTLLPFIMCHDLNATALQIACIISLRPVVSVFSLYWSAQIKKKKESLISNIVWASVLGHLPFFFVYWFFHPYYLIFASATYMLFHRGVHPAWMELLKTNIPEEERKNVFAYSSACYHVGGAVLALIIASVLDNSYEAWRFLFPCFALISFGSILFLLKIPIKTSFLISDSLEPSISFKEKIQKPWKDSIALLKTRPDFAKFQIGFMLGGGGLMLWQPALPQFFFDILHLNFKELTIAITLCKSLGYICSLPLWTRLMGKVDIFTFCGVVSFIAFLFPFGLIAAEWHLLWLYAAYIIYGLMQGGSELSWNLSGPIFSRHEDSSLYSGVNVVTVGLRGCVAPPLGSLLCYLQGPLSTLMIGSALCVLAAWQMFGVKEELRLKMIQKA